jgi:hypothetical protein
MIHLNNILNILKLGNNWLNYKHNEKKKTKNLISESYIQQSQWKERENQRDIK